MCRLRKPRASRTILQSFQTGIESLRRKGWLFDPIRPTNQISSLADAALEGPLVLDLGREHTATVGFRASGPRSSRSSISPVRFKLPRRPTPKRTKSWNARPGENTCSYQRRKVQMSWVTAISSPVPAASPILITSASPPPPITAWRPSSATSFPLTNSFKLSKQSNHGGTNQKTLGEKRATP
jgi:hypothetical protein